MNQLNKIKLGKRLVTDNSLPYIIAEIGVNHEGSLKQAIHLIDLAKEGGADAVKFQTYKAETLASKNSPSYWDLTKEKTRSQYKLFKKYDSFTKEDYYSLFEYCQDINIDFLSTPFDIEAVDFLDEIIPFFKIASADITNLPFLRKVASKGKPVLISTGASDKKEIDYAIKVLNDYGAKSIGILHCILNYPTSEKNASLNMIKGLREDYPDFIIGYSDHTLPCSNMLTLTTSYLLGAVVIEKHFTNNKNLEGNDHYHAMDINDLKNFKIIASRIKNIKGEINKKICLHSEEISRLNARRSIVANRQLKKGEFIKENDIICKRPGTGISPKNWDSILGMRLKKDIEYDQILQWDDIESL